MVKRSFGHRETYLWVSDGAKFKKDENDKRPWKVDVITSDWHNGCMYFETLCDAHKFMRESVVDGEYPF